MILRDRQLPNNKAKKNEVQVTKTGHSDFDCQFYCQGSDATAYLFKPELRKAMKPSTERL